MLDETALTDDGTVIDSVSIRRRGLMTQGTKQDMRQLPE